MKRIKLIPLVSVIVATGCASWPEDRESESGWHSTPVKDAPFQNVPEAESRGEVDVEQSGTASTYQRPTIFRPQATEDMPVAVEPPVVDAPSVEGIPAPSPTLATLPEQGGNPAVVSLLSKADIDYAQGNYQSTLAQLERAARIEPRNAYIWYKMAAVQMSLEEPAKAESLAYKSLSVAAGDKEMVVANWELIAGARRMRGDTRGAEDAERKAALAAKTG